MRREDVSESECQEKGANERRSETHSRLILLHTYCIQTHHMPIPLCTVVYIYIYSILSVNIYGLKGYIAPFAPISGLSALRMSSRDLLQRARHESSGRHRVARLALATGRPQRCHVHPRWRPPAQERRPRCAGAPPAGSPVRPSSGRRCAGRGGRMKLAKLSGPVFGGEQ